MDAAEMLMSRFAASEVGDFRMTPEERVAKTAKLVTDMSEEIGALMERWLASSGKFSRVKKKLFFFLKIFF